MTAIKEGDWVRYSDDFCQSTSTTDMGRRDIAGRRGKVESIFEEGSLCTVDWGDIFVQFSTNSRSIVVLDNQEANDRNIRYAARNKQ